SLLRREVRRARQLREWQAGLGVAVAAVALVVGGFYYLETQSASDAKDNLNAAQAQGSTLTAQKAQYAQVPRTLAAIEAAEMSRQDALVKDVLWYRYLNDLS